MSASIGRGRRVLIGVVAATLLIAIGAVPSYGATKQFRLEVTPSSAVAGTSTDFTVKITNTTPGNSAINSFSVNVPFPLTPGSPPQLLPPPDSTNANATATVTVVGSQVRVQNIDSLKTSQVIRLRVTATPAALPPPPCVGSAQWNANAYAGNSLSGDQFTNQGTIAQRTTTLLGCLTLRFVDGFAPKDGTANTGQHVMVEAISGGQLVSSFTGPVTIVGTGPGNLIDAGPVNAIGGIADFPTFGGDAAGAYLVRATSPGVTDSVPAPFTLFADSLGCDDLSDTLSQSGGTITFEFLDPADCADVPYTPSFNEANKTLTIDKPGALVVPLKITVDAWPVELVPVVEDDLQIPPTLVTPPGDPFAPVQWCEGTGPSSWTPPKGESWCLISQEATNVGPGPDGQFMQVTDVMVLVGDAGARRK